MDNFQVFSATTRVLTARVFRFQLPPTVRLRSAPSAQSAPSAPLASRNLEPDTTRLDPNLSLAFELSRQSKSKSTLTSNKTCPRKPFKVSAKSTKYSPNVLDRPKPIHFPFSSQLLQHRPSHHHRHRHHPVFLTFPNPISPRLRSNPHSKWRAASCATPPRRSTLPERSSPVSSWASLYVLLTFNTRVPIPPSSQPQALTRDLRLPNHGNETN